MSSSATQTKKVKRTNRVKPSSASSPPATPRKPKHSSGSRLVRRKGGEPLSAHDLDLLEKLRHRKDSDIEFSDIPEVKVNTFTNRSGTAHLFRPYKQQITLRIDSDVIAWAKQEGTGYQSRINAALRTAMLKDTLTTRQTG